MSMPLKRNQACSKCKERKIKCDAVSPACLPCRRSAEKRGEDPSTITCQYPAQSAIDAEYASRKGRKLKPRTCSWSSSGRSDVDMNYESERISLLEARISRLEKINSELLNALIGRGIVGSGVGTAAFGFPMNGSDLDRSNLNRSSVATTSLYSSPPSDIESAFHGPSSEWSGRSRSDSNNSSIFSFDLKTKMEMESTNQELKRRASQPHLTQCQETQQQVLPLPPPIPISFPSSSPRSNSLSSQEAIPTFHNYAPLLSQTSQTNLDWPELQNFGITTASHVVEYTSTTTPTANPNTMEVLNQFSHFNNGEQDDHMTSPWLNNPNLSNAQQNFVQI